MTLYGRVCALATALTLVASCAVLLGNQRLAYAASDSESNTHKVCFAFNGTSAATTTLSGTCPSGTGEGGTLVVQKLFASGTTSPSMFSFSVGGGSAIPFEVSGINVMTVATGTYTVQELATSTYTTSYTGCNVSILAGATSTCTITNSLVATTSPSASDIAITKTVDNVSPLSGSTISYTLTVSNSGPATALDVSVIDILGSGLTYLSDDAASSLNGAYASSTGIWTIGSLAAHTSTVLHISALVGVGTGGQKITNSATVVNSNGDPGSSNNTEIVTISVAHPVAGNSSAPGTSDAQTSLSACDPYVTAYIKPGQQNDPEQVRRLQFVLKTYENAPIEMTGVYDATTLEAVKTFQKKYATGILIPWGITEPTGFVYITTGRELNRLYCKASEASPMTLEQISIINESQGVGSGASSYPLDFSDTTPQNQEQEKIVPVASQVDSRSDSSTATASSTVGGGELASSPVRMNPLQAIGDFFKNLFTR